MSDEIGNMLQGIFGKTMMFTKRPEIINEFAKEGNCIYTDDGDEVMKYLCQFFDYELYRGQYTESVKWAGQHPAFKKTYFEVHGREFKPAEFLHYCLYPWGNDNVEIRYERIQNTFYKRVKNVLKILPNPELEKMAYQALSKYMKENFDDRMVNPKSFFDGFMAAHKYQYTENNEETEDHIY